MTRIPAVALDHVGIATAEPGNALSSALGGLEPARLMPSGVQVARFGPGAGLECVWPGRDSNPVAGFLAKRGPGLHHIALRVDVPLDGLVADLAAAGMAATGPVEPSADGRPSAFLHPGGTGGVLVELVEGPSR
jgi:hypothetical protein